MKYDPILDEVHRIKDEIGDECNGDVRKLMAELARSGATTNGGAIIHSPEELRKWAATQTPEPATTIKSELSSN
jgi:hypothetical protein